MKASEKRLLSLFLLLLAAVGGMVLTQRLKAWQHNVEVKEHKLSLERMETEGMLAQASEWKAAAAWLAERPPSRQVMARSPARVPGCLEAPFPSGRSRRSGRGTTGRWN